jgi:GTP-binding protein
MPPAYNQGGREEYMDFRKVQFLLSAYAIGQLPAPDYPDIAFAGRSNVGKSSLINRLVDRTSLVKTSSKPGKTQSLNYFLVDDALYLVDLPGYGFAQVSQQTRQSWQGLDHRICGNQINPCLRGCYHRFAP